MGGIFQRGAGHMIRFFVAWAIGSIVTFTVALSMMSAVYSLVRIAAWCILAWPIYLVICIVTFLNNP